LPLALHLRGILFEVEVLLPLAVRIYHVAGTLFQEFVKSGVLEVLKVSTVRVYGDIPEIDCRLRSESSLSGTDRRIRRVLNFHAGNLELLELRV